MSKQFSFEITFAREEQLQGKKLKKAIDDYHFLTPGTTKRIKSKAPSSEENSALEGVDDGSKRYPIGFKIYKLFDGVPFTGTIVGYDANHKLYQIKYTDGDQEEFYNNEVHAHKDPIKPSSPTTLPTQNSPLLQMKKRKDIRCKHRT